MIYLIGVITGIITGLALGGGAVLIPFLVIFLEVQQHMAQGVSLAVFLPMSFIAIITHIKQQNILIKLALYIMITSIIGAIVGSLLAMRLQSDFLQNLYGVFLIVMGVLELCQAKTMYKK